MERLAIQIQRLVEEVAGKPMRITKEGIGISHIFFAGDVLLFSQASKDHVQLIAKTLNDLCGVSGMKVNLEKSRLFCSKNIDQNVQQELSNILGIRRAANSGNILAYRS